MMIDWTLSHWGDIIDKILCDLFPYKVDVNYYLIFNSSTKATYYIKLVSYINWIV